MKLLGGATSLVYFLKACNSSETKCFFLCHWFNNPDNLQNTELPIYDATNGMFSTCNLLEPEYFEYVFPPKKVDHRSSCFKIQIIKATRYWDWELSKPARTMEAGANEFVHRLFALAYQWRCSSNFGGNEQVGCHLPQ